MINSIITKTLKETNLPIIFITKSTPKQECIVFNILESPFKYSDDTEEITEYDILLNLYINDKDLIETTIKIKELMKNAGFIKKQVPTAQYDEESRLINQPLHFYFIKESEL